jgi:magnesium transporter
VRHGASRSYTEMRRRCEATPKVLSEGEDFIVYAILDFIADNYFPVLTLFGEEVETIEDGVMAPGAASLQIDRLYRMRRDLLRLRNAVVPLVDVCTRLERSEVMPIDASMRPHFRDVTDLMCDGFRRRSRRCAKFSLSPSRRV